MRTDQETSLQIFLLHPNDLESSSNLTTVLFNYLQGIQNTFILLFPMFLVCFLNLPNRTKMVKYVSRRLLKSLKILYQNKYEVV